MGTKAAPGLANCFMGNSEEEFVYKYRLQPLVYLRFLDDCFLIWQHSQDELESFVSCLHSIKFTMEASEIGVNFLDTTVKLVNNRIETDLYCKPTDANNYLLYKSAHPRNCKDSIPYSQFLRIRRICTNIEDFDKHTINFCLHFQRRGYPLPLLEKAALAARRIPRNNLLNKPKKDPVQTDSKIVMVTRYHPHHDTLRDIVTNNWDFLGKTNTTQFLHDKKLMVGYRRPQNLRDLIVSPSQGTQNTKDHPHNPEKNNKCQITAISK